MRVKDHAAQASHFRKSGSRLRAKSRMVMRYFAVLAARKMRHPVGRKTELPYDDDPAWNASFARSLDALQRLAEKAQKDHDEGRTAELDPDQL